MNTDPILQKSYVPSILRFLTRNIKLWNLRLKMVGGWERETILKPGRILFGIFLSFFTDFRPLKTLDEKYRASCSWWRSHTVTHTRPDCFSQRTWAGFTQLQRKPACEETCNVFSPFFPTPWSMEMRIIKTSRVFLGYFHINRQGKAVKIIFKTFKEPEKQCGWIRLMVWA